MNTKKITLDLTRLDDNAFAILGAFQVQARREYWTEQDIESVVTEAMSKDYNHLLATIMAHCEVSYDRN